MGKPIKVENSIYDLTSANQAMSDNDQIKILYFIINQWDISNKDNK